MENDTDRIRDLLRFYSLLAEFGRNVAGPKQLSECTGRDGWPQRGIYFFQEPGERRSDSGTGNRIVRVGTHALKTGSRTSLWNSHLYQRLEGTLHDNLTLIEFLQLKGSPIRVSGITSI
jgi:hypothetical protein